MKKIEAVIRKSKFRELKKALINAGIDNFSYWLVRNVGEATETRVYRGVEYKTSALERIAVTFIIGDNQLDILDLFTDSGLTGEAGDGRLLISAVSEAYQLVTKEGKEVAVKLSNK